MAEQNLGDCSLLLGVIYLSDQVVIACPQHILLLSKAGELIDQIDQNIGLQQIFTATTSENDTVFLQDNKAVYRLNTDDLSFAIAANYPNNWLKPVLPSARISMERWLLDAHSGAYLDAGACGLLMRWHYYSVCWCSAVGLWPKKDINECFEILLGQFQRL